MTRKSCAVVFAACAIFLSINFYNSPGENQLEENQIVAFTLSSNNSTQTQTDSIDSQIPDFSLDSINEQVSEHPAESVILIAALGGLGVYLFGLRNQRKQLNKALKHIITSKSEERKEFRASLKALDILKKARATVFTLGPFSWLWDDLLHPIISEKMTEHGISEIFTFEGIFSWILFEFLGLKFMSPIEFEQILFPQIRIVSTVLFILFVYWIFFKGDSLINKYQNFINFEKPIDNAENEEKERPRKGYV